MSRPIFADDAIRARIGLLTEDRKKQGLVLQLSVRENLVLPILGSLSRFGIVSRRREHEKASRYARDLRIKTPSLEQVVLNLSGGNQQKVVLGKWLACQVDILILDEPTRGIDVGSKAQIYRLIDQLAAGDPATGRRPRAVLVVSSYLPELLGICDRIAVMCRGQLGESRPVAELNEHRIMLAATGAA